MKAPIPCRTESGEKPLPALTKTCAVWIAVALALVTAGVYWPVTGFHFLDYDDPVFVTANPHVQAGLTVESFKWAWGSVVVSNWHPVTMLSHILDCQLFGIKPWWPHLVNLLLHTANTVLLFGLLKRMTGAVWRSAIVAAFFALHPLHVESVAWVSERKDVLSTLFWFLTTWAYVRYVQNARDKYFYGLSLLFFALGLMSKPMLVTLPLTLLLLDFWPLRRRAVWEKIPFFAMSAALCVVTLRVQKESGAMSLMRHVPVGERVVNAVVSYVRYIGRMVWPGNLAGFYPMRLGQWPGWVAGLAALALAGVTVAVVAQWRRRPYLAAGWFWYVGTLVPVIGLVQVGGQAMADRYTYVPLIGLFVMVAWGGWELAGAWRLGRYAAGAAVGAVAACAGLTAHQEFYWKDSETFNKRMLDVTSNNYIAHNNLGTMDLNANRTEEAISNYMVAVEENPDYADSHYNLGTVLAGQNRFDEAIRQYREAIRLRPDYGQAHYNLGIALGRQGQLDGATSQYREAIRAKPDFVEAFYNLGTVLARKGQLDEAIAQYREAIRLRPDFVEAHYNLGVDLARKGQRVEAIREYREVMRLRPDFAGAQQALSELESPPPPSQGGHQ